MVFVANADVQREIFGGLEIILKEIGVIPLFGAKGRFVYRLSKQRRIIV